MKMPVIGTPHSGVAWEKGTRFFVVILLVQFGRPRGSQKLAEAIG